MKKHLSLLLAAALLAGMLVVAPISAFATPEPPGGDPPVAPATGIFEDKVFTVNVPATGKTLGDKAENDVDLEIVDGLYIDLVTNTLVYPAGVEATIKAFSVKSGKWVSDLSKLDLTKLLKKDLELKLSTEFANKTGEVKGTAAVEADAEKEIEAAPAKAGATVYTFAKISAPEKKKLVANYDAKWDVEVEEEGEGGGEPTLVTVTKSTADLTGVTDGKWALTEKGQSKIFAGDVQIKEVDGDWKAVPEEGAAVAPIKEDGSVQKDTFLARTAPVKIPGEGDAADKYISAGKEFKVKVLGAGKATKFKANYKNETLKAKVGVYYFVDAAVAGVDAEKVATPVLNIGEYINLQNKVSFFNGATDKKPASAKQVYTFAKRAAIADTTFAPEKGKVKIDKKYEIQTGTKWGGLKKVTSDAQFSIRIKADAKGGKEDDSTFAASEVGKLNLTWGEYDAEKKKNGIVAAALVAPLAPDAKLAAAKAKIEAYTYAAVTSSDALDAPAALVAALAQCNAAIGGSEGWNFVGVGFAITTVTFTGATDGDPNGSGLYTFDVDITVAGLYEADGETLKKATASGLSFVIKPEGVAEVLIDTGDAEESGDGFIKVTAPAFISLVGGSAGILNFAVDFDDTKATGYADVVVTVDDGTIVDNGDGTYSVSGVTKDTVKITVVPVVWVNVTFTKPASITVDPASVKVAPGGDFTFEVTFDNTAVDLITAASSAGTLERVSLSGVGTASCKVGYAVTGIGDTAVVVTIAEAAGLPVTAPAPIADVTFDCPATAGLVISGTFAITDDKYIKTIKVKVNGVDATVGAGVWSCAVDGSAEAVVVTVETVEWAIIVDMSGAVGKYVAMPEFTVEVMEMNGAGNTIVNRGVRLPKGVPLSAPHRIVVNFDYSNVWDDAAKTPMAPYTWGSVIPVFTYLGSLRDIQNGATTVQWDATTGGNGPAGFSSVNLGGGGNETDANPGTYLKFNTPGVTGHRMGVAVVIPAGTVIGGDITFAPRAADFATGLVFNQP